MDSEWSYHSNFCDIVVVMVLFSFSTRGHFLLFVLAPSGFFSLCFSSLFYVSQIFFLLFSFVFLAWVRALGVTFKIFNGEEHYFAKLKIYWVVALVIN